MYSERVCFLEAMRAAGQISDAEYLIMVKWFRAMTQSPMKERIGPDLVGSAVAGIPLQANSLQTLLFFVQSTSVVTSQFCGKGSAAAGGRRKRVC